ncbi:MAG: hypothetical protein IKF19_06800 [Bacilli bacterium]|nr:hypothetical protein [Bacilli bacterium]
MPKKKIIISCFILILISIITLNSILKPKQKLTTKTTISNQDNLKISIDGISSEALPTSGNYYLTKYTCYSNKTKVNWDSKNYKLSITNRNKKAGVSCNLTFKSNPLLNEMAPGSYVKYQGNGGKVGTNQVNCKYNGTPSSTNQTDNTESPNSCLGQNAREDIDAGSTYGYCYNGNYKYYTTGWRIAYINKDGKNPKAVIISAASPECINSNNENILNTRALKYCNNEYVDNNCSCNDSNKDGLCDENSKDVWSLTDKDLSKIISKNTTKNNEFNITNCFNNKSTTSCGYSNDLIDNGGYYWLTTTNNAFWDPDNRVIATGEPKTYGLRAMIQLSSSVIVTSGDGTIDNPYIINNNDFTINNGETYTNKRDVTLNIIGSNATKMCISNNSKCEDYIDFSNKVNWQLSNKDGTKNVYIYLKDNRGKLLTSLHQKIILDTIGPTNNKLEVIDKTANKIKVGINSNNADYMCIGMTEDLNQCNWIRYQEEYDLVLDSTDGIKTIYAHFKDKAENISSKSLTYDCETCNESFTASYNFDGSKTIEEINKEEYISISTDNNNPWQIDQNNKYLASTNKNIDNSVSETTITIKPTTNATLSFDYGVSSESNYDKLSIVIENNGSKNILVNSISGTKEDRIKNYNLTKNETYILSLKYTKDNKGNVGKDIGYIKNIIIK